jgi:hypothetical protein
VVVPGIPRTSTGKFLKTALRAQLRGHYQAIAEGGTAEGGTAEGGTAEGGTAEGGTAEGGTAEGGGGP